MSRILAFAVVFVIVLSSNTFAQVAPKTSPAAAPVPAETKELVRRLLEANGMRASIIRIFEDIIKQAPAESQKQLRDALQSDAIIDNIIPIYAKHFTPDEIRELIAFYKSPIGAKNLALTSQLMTEVMEVSGQYFQDKVSKIETPATSQTAPK